MGRSPLLACALCLAAVGCDAGPRALYVERVELPAGGVVSAIAAGAGARPVALTSRGLFERTGERWSPLEAPAAIAAGASAAFGRDGRFVGFLGELWFLEVRGGGLGPRLWRGGTERGWRRVVLPGRYRDGRAQGSTGLRLVPYDGALFLLDASRLWRLEASSAGARWEGIDLRGVALTNADERDPLPPVLRHYLPPTTGRPWELLTVLADQLKVYRRARDQQAWALVSTLPALDVALWASESGEAVAILSRDSVWRSQIGESWERVRIVASEAVGEECTALWAAPGGEVFVVGTSLGAIYRSEDGARSFAAAREASSIRLPIGSFLGGEGSDDLWASTRGAGVLRSPDGGRAWIASNRGLRATTPYAMELTGERLAVGSDAGLFVTGDALRRAPRWRALHTQPTSALLERGGVFWSGTLGGGIVRSGAGGEAPRSIQMTRSAPSAIEYFPPDKRGLLLTPEAIVGFEARAGGPIVALSHRYGRLSALDPAGDWLVEPMQSELSAALDGAHVTSFALAPGGARYLTSQPVRPQQRAQLWRSVDDGATWRSIYTFGSEANEGMLKIASLPTDALGEALLLARDSGVARSRDGGAQWEALEGEWGAGRLLAFRVQGTSALMMIEGPGGVEVVEIEDARNELSVVRRYELRARRTERVERGLDLLLSERALYVRTADAIVRAVPSNRADEATRGLLALLAVALTVVLGSIGYLLIRVSAPRARS